MNNNEKKGFAYILGREAEVLEKLKKAYERALKDVQTRIRLMQSNELMQDRVYWEEYQEALEGQLEVILETLHNKEHETILDYLQEIYRDGFLIVMYSLFQQGIPMILPIDQRQVVRAVMTNSAISEGLYRSLGVDVARLRETISAEISRGIASGMSLGDITRNIAGRAEVALNRARTIVVTESHRIQEEAAQDARVGAKENGCDVVKQWDATMDGRTRPTHRRLDGQVREVDEPFEIDGKRAMQPGGFGLPEEDINCRCISVTRARWALGEADLRRMQEKARHWHIDKTLEFEEFRRRYLAVEE